MWPKPSHGECHPAREVRSGRASRAPFGRALASAIAIALAAGLWAAASGGGSWVRRAEAQQDRPKISVPAETKAEAASRTRLQIEVGPSEAIARHSFLRIRGLPPAVALSGGHSIAPGAWAVPLNALPNLTIVLPVGQQAPAEVAISLVSIEGNVLAEAKTTLVVVQPPPRAGGPAPGNAAPRVVVVPKLSPEERERALGLHAKGLEQLEHGSVYAARKFFELAAEMGLPQSAVAAAGTYDPDELARLRVIGLQPDVEAARKWYERARELGAAEAGDRLRRLGSR
jgi:TPR repeat protein